jgi:CheY-like chemotaxis protein
MTKMLQRMIGEDIGLVTDLDPALEWVKIDPVQVEQVIMNLAVNARDAMPAGGRLTIATRNAEIGTAETVPPAGHLPPGRYVTLTVADTGCGMTPEVKARLFEPFFTTKERGRGTGLGLATVYGIVGQNGGEIRVESAPGKGAAFTIFLPRVEEALEQPPPSSKPKDMPAGKETVLVVEDDEIIRNLIREVLADSKYTVMDADRGAEALRLAEKREGPIQLLITDVVMPGISGPEVAAHLARYRPEMKVLYISGYTDDKIGRQGLLESGAGFLQKPFRIEALTRKVREVLDVP